MSEGVSTPDEEGPDRPPRQGGRPGITLEAVARAMAALEADGQSPSIRAIKRTLGTGSSERISTLREAVLGQRALEQGTPERGTPLAAVLKIGVEFLEKLAGEAAAANVELVEGIRREAEEAVQTANGRAERAERASDAAALERERAMGRADTLAAQVREAEESADALAARLHDVEGDREAFREEAARHKVAAERAEERLAREGEAHERRIERLERQLAEEREGRRESEREATRATTTLELAVAERDRAQEALEVRTEALAARTAEHDAALERVRAHRRELAESKRARRRQEAEAGRQRDARVALELALGEARARAGALEDELREHARLARERAGNPENPADDAR